MNFIRRALGSDRGSISIPINAGLMVVLSVLLLALPNVALFPTIVLLLVTVALIIVFVGIVFDDEISLDGNRFALAGGLVVACLIFSFAGLYHVQSQHNSHSFSAKLDRIDAVYFAIGTVSTSGTNGIVARSGSARTEVAIQELVDITALALLIGGVIRRLGSRTHRMASMPADLAPARRSDTCYEERKAESTTSTGGSLAQAPALTHTNNSPSRAVSTNT